MIILCVTLELLTLIDPTYYSVCCCFLKIHHRQWRWWWGVGGWGVRIPFIVATCGKIKRNDNMCDGGVTAGRALCWSREKMFHLCWEEPYGEKKKKKENSGIREG